MRKERAYRLGSEELRTALRRWRAALGRHLGSDVVDPFRGFASNLYSRRFQSSICVFEGKNTREQR